MVSASSSNYQVKIFEIMISTIFSAYFVMQSCYQDGCYVSVLFTLP